MANRPAVKITIPDPSADRLSFKRLAWVSGTCFLLGIAWPVLVQIDFVQRPPGSSPAKPDGAEPPPLDSDDAPEPTPPPDSERSVPAARLEPAPAWHALRIEQTIVASCRDQGRRAASCDTPDLASVTAERLERLASCEAAQGQSGILSLGLELDFSEGRVLSVKAGQSTTLAGEVKGPLVACADQILVGADLEGIAHQHETYWLYYLLRFTAPPSSDEAASSAEPVAASGRATIGWRTAVVRDGPSRQAKTAARLLYGTRVDVTGRVGDWYRINYDGRGSVGWVHRKAIGL